MADSRQTAETSHPVKRLSTLRLFTFVVLFLVLAGYSVWKSDRFQSLIQGVSQSRLSEALGVPVSFETVDLRVLPPSVALTNVRVGNDPRLGFSDQAPLLTAETITIGGGTSIGGGELRLGRIRAVHPRIVLRQLADGRWNLPPGMAGPTRRGGLKVKIASLLVQEGVLDFEGRAIKLDGTLEDFAAELRSSGPDRYSGVLLTRRGTFRLPKAEPIVAGLAIRFALEGSRALVLDDVRISGPFGRLVARGAVENLDRPRTNLLVEGDVSIDEVERIFHSKLGFEGAASIRARLEVPPGGVFRATGTIRAARARKAPFVFQDVSATVTARPAELVARIEKARYGGGEAQGSLRIADLVGAQAPMTLTLEASGISLESFFADLGLKGTGLAGDAGLTLALRWGPEGITRAGGGGRLDVRAGRAGSQVRGRFGIPTEGGGPLTVVRGRLGFEDCTLRFPHSALDFRGGIQIGEWQPDFDFRLRSRDLSEVDRIFQNFLAAGGSPAEALGLAGNGEVAGHLAGTWAMPRATLRIATEDTRFGGALFGSVRGTVDMADGAFDFRPLRVYEGDASLSLEGSAAYRVVPSRPKFDLTVAARRYPIDRILAYLDLDYPVQGKLSGDLALRGSKDALTGGGSVELDAASVWGQPLEKLNARVELTPGRFELGEIRAPLGGGMLGGSGAVRFPEKLFEARLAGDGISLDAIEALAPYRSDVSGKLSFQASGSGDFAHPDATASATLTDVRFLGRQIPAGREPALRAALEHGVLKGEIAVRDRWKAAATGDLFTAGSPISVSLEANDLAALLEWTPVEPCAGCGGSLSASGSLVLPAEGGRPLSGDFRVEKVALDLPSRPAALRASGVHVTLSGEKLEFDPFEVSGEGTSLQARGSLGIGSAAGGNLSVSGSLDPALIGAVVPEFSLTGRLQVSLAASGSISNPNLSGEVRIENGKYRLTSVPQLIDDIDGRIRLSGSGGDVDLRAKVGGGEAFAAGTFGLRGLTVQTFRLTLQGRHVTVRYPEDLRLLLDADLVASGDSGGNVVRGEVVLQRGTYSRDFDVTLTDLLAPSRPAGIGVREAWKDRTRLEVRITSSQALEVRNNLARLTGTVDLVARGTVAEPSLIGQVVLDEGGRVTFRDVRYDIESGTLTFASIRGLAPILDIRARAEVKGYDLVVTLAGTWPRIETSFSSDPPLSDEAIVGLLLTGAQAGVSPTTTADTSPNFASAAGGIVGSAATGVLTRPAQKLFRLERFQIDPIFTSTGFSGATTTVGKQINPNWSVTYSQPLFEASSREPVVEVEGRISQTWVLRLRRDENGVYLIDLRRRTRP